MRFGLTRASSLVPRPDDVLRDAEGRRFPAIAHHLAPERGSERAPKGLEPRALGCRSLPQAAFKAS